MILSSILAAAGQLSLKKGALAFNQLNSNTISYLFALARNPFIWGGFISYGLSFMVYMIVLRKVELSTARSFSALSYVIVISLSFIIYKDDFSWLKLAGILAIAGGITMIALADR